MYYIFIYDNKKYYITKHNYSLLDTQITSSFKQLTERPYVSPEYTEWK